MSSHPKSRHYFIELLSYWQGSVNSSQLIQQFGLSRQQCSAALKEYQQLAPQNLAYSNTQKAYIPTLQFNRLFINDDVNDYLHWLQTQQIISEPIGKAISCKTLALPARQVTPAVMRGIVEAIKKGFRLDVEYVSLSNPNDQGRVIAPHSFVNTGSRWHLRAYCEKSASYRDFVLSRFRGKPYLLDKSQHTSAHDTAWNTQVTLLIKPDQRLSTAKRAVIEQDYQMQNGQLTLTTRGCFVNYLLQELQINPKILDGNPDAQQLVLVNLPDIKPWLFDA